VRRPRQDTSERVAAYLRHLEAAGYAGAPRYLGIDAQGRDVLTYLEGDVPGAPVEEWAAADSVLRGVARMVRRLHDASEGYAAPPRPVPPGRPTPVFPEGEPRIFAQRDVTPQNTVFRDGVAWGVIDFDLCDWTTRSLDLANTAVHWVPMNDPADRASVHDDIDVPARIRLLLDGYGRDGVTAEQFLQACELRFANSYAVMRWSAENLGGGWQRMWDEGVGDVIQRREGWFASVRDDLARSLLAGDQGAPPFTQNADRNQTQGGGQDEDADRQYAEHDENAD
jgi:Ser/Thr protein kinase RdoA (MazF antagonist)